MDHCRQPDPIVHGSFQDDVSASEWDRYYLELDILGRYFLAYFSQSKSFLTDRSEDSLHLVSLAPTTYNDWPKLSRALKQMSREGFYEFCSDIAEEISRRNNDLRDGITFLPSYNDVSLGRNHTRRKLASIPSRRFHELCMRTCFEIGRRSPRWSKRVLKRSFSRSHDPISKVVSAASIERARLLDNYHHPIYPIPASEISPTQNLPTLLGNLHDDFWSPDESNLLFPNAHRDRFEGTMLTIFSLFVSILRDTSRYEALLQCRGDAAQQVLDILQMLLDCPEADATSKRSLLVALTRLSGKSGLHPRCFNLTGIVRGESPVCSGAFGDIWKGDFKGQTVCLKILKMYKSTSREELLKVFAREAVLWSHTSHPNLLPFYGIFRFEEGHGRICLVSPWMSRGNINEYLAHVPNASRTLLAIDIASGLSYLHERGIVHGDLKGANILVTDGGRACISDFGSSTIQDAFHNTQRKGSPSLSGTTRWLAPELLSPEVEFPKASPESDVYAYACVLYEIYTGQIPFYEYARDVTVILQIFRGKTPTRPPAHGQPFREWGLTDAKWAIMESCWERDPKSRPRIGVILEYLADADPDLVDGRPRDDWEDQLGSQFRNSVYRNDRLSMGVLETVLSWI